MAESNELLQTLINNIMRDFVDEEEGPTNRRIRAEHALLDRIDQAGERFTSTGVVPVEAISASGRNIRPAEADSYHGGVGLMVLDMHCLSDKCLACTKKRAQRRQAFTRRNIPLQLGSLSTFCKEALRSPEDNLAVMVAITGLDVQNSYMRVRYIKLRCQDPMCLLGLLRLSTLHQTAKDEA